MDQIMVWLHGGAIEVDGRVYIFPHGTRVIKELLRNYLKSVGVELELEPQLQPDKVD